MKTLREYIDLIDRTQSVAEGSDHSLKKVWDRYAKHLGAARGDHANVRQIMKSGKILQDIRKYVKDHYGQEAVDNMERYAEKRQWDRDLYTNGMAEEQLEETTPDAVRRVEELFQDK